MDEPTNHLDEDSRMALYDFIATAQATMLIASHDITLLNHMPALYELSEQGIRSYPMKYTDYRKTIEDENRARIQTAESLKKELRKEKNIAREVTERQQRQNSRGQHHSDKKCVARIAMGNLKNKAENSTARLSESHQKKIARLAGQISEAAGQIHNIRRLTMDFASPDIHSGKILINAQGINFAYRNRTYLWTRPLDITIRSGDRIRVRGNNGSGKSTLMKILMGEQPPTTGSVFRCDNLRYVYLDQEYSLIDNELSVYDQLQQFNRHALPEHELKIRLNRFLFAKQAYDKQCVALSGGEKMRLSLCCLMVSDSTPDIIIADEPTNNLDLYNIEPLTNMLKNYSGTLIVISHDTEFANRLSLSKEIIL